MCVRREEDKIFMGLCAGISPYQTRCTSCVYRADALFFLVVDVRPSIDTHAPALI